MLSYIERKEREKPGQSHGISLEEGCSSHDETRDEGHAWERGDGGREGTAGRLGGRSGLRGGSRASRLVRDGGHTSCRSWSADGSSGRTNSRTVDLGGDGGVERARHASECELGGERGEWECRVGRVLEANGRKLDEVDCTVGAKVRIGSVSDLGILADVEGRRDVLEAGLLGNAASAEVDGASADVSKGRLIAIVVPSDCALLARGHNSASDRLGNVDGARHLGDEGRGDESESS